MVWVRIADDFTDHPKVVQAGPLAGWLYVCGLTYANRYLTDGFIPAAQIRRMADVDDAASLAERLVNAGLWEHAEGGFLIHDYHMYQPTADDVKRERAESARRQAEYRKRKGVSSSVSNAVTNSVTHGVSNAERLGAPYPARTRPVHNHKHQTPTSFDVVVAACADAHDGLTATAKTTKAKSETNAGYLSLSEPARAVVDDWRSKQGKKRPPKLNPAQAEELELAVVELGAERLCEANTWAARNGVPEIVKAIRAARTKRQRDEDSPPHSENPSTHLEPDGAACGGSLAPPTDADAALWDGARSDLAEQMSRPNWETYIAPLDVAGRAADGGLRLRAPPGLTTALRRFRGVIVRSLDDAGDPGATRVAIVEARPGQE